MNDGYANVPEFCNDDDDTDDEILGVEFRHSSGGGRGLSE